MLHALRMINKENRVEGFSIVVCKDGNIVLDKIHKKVKKYRGVFVGVPLQLGVDFVNPEYLESVKFIFTQF